MMMELNNIYKVFFVLLRAGLWSKKPDYDCFPLKEEEWQFIYTLARKQTVEGIVYDGIMQLPNDSLPPKALLMKWTVLVDSLERRNKQMNLLVGELSRLFEENFITAFLLKGQGVAACYDAPLHRVCGDIDWFFQNRSDFEKAAQLIANKGIQTKAQDRGSVAYYWKGFLIEHHQHLLDIHNPFVFSYINRLRQAEYNKRIYGTFGEVEVALPSPLLTHLSINSHILKHMLVFGVGIRQLCDSARIYSIYHQKLDGIQLKEVYCKVRIYRWIELLNNILVKELGLPVEYLPFEFSTEVKTDWMMKDLLLGGNFGFYNECFGPKSDSLWKKNIHALWHLFRYAECVPSEAFWYPMVLAYSRIRNYILR